MTTDIEIDSINLLPRFWREGRKEFVPLTTAELANTINDTPRSTYRQLRTLQAEDMVRSIRIEGMGGREVRCFELTPRGQRFVKDFAA